MTNDRQVLSDLYTTMLKEDISANKPIPASMHFNKLGEFWVLDTDATDDEIVAGPVPGELNQSGIDALVKSYSILGDVKVADLSIIKEDREHVAMVWDVFPEIVIIWSVPGFDIESAL